MMEFAHSLHYIAEDIEEYTKQPYENNEYNKTPNRLSTTGIAKLHRVLLNNEIHNKRIDEVKQGLCNKFLRELVDAQKDNIAELQLENTLLINSLEKYRRLYFELKNK